MLNPKKTEFPYLIIDCVDELADDGNALAKPVRKWKMHNFASGLKARAAGNA